MKKIVLLLMYMISCAVTALPLDEMPDFKSWKTQCDTHLPMSKKPDHVVDPLLSLKAVNSNMKAYKDKMKTFLKNDTDWVDPQQKLDSLFDEPQLEKKEGNWQEKKYDAGFSQSILLDKTAKLAIHGDFHGDIFSMLAFIAPYVDDNWKITDKNRYLVFLGDYVDRGYYGTETLMTLLKLKATNPTKVLAVRGNHEHASQNSAGSDPEKDYKVYQRYLKQRYKADHNEVYKSIYGAYKLFPLAIYIGVLNKDKVANFIVNVHGGIELGYKPQALITKSLSLGRRGSLVSQYIDTKQINRETVLQDFKKYVDAIEQPEMKRLSKDIDDFTRDYSNAATLDRLSQSNGFVWADFDKSSSASFVATTRSQHPKESLVYSLGGLATPAFLAFLSTDDYIIRTVFRAHEAIRVNNKYVGLTQFWPTKAFTDNSLVDISVISFGFARLYYREYQYNYLGELKFNGGEFEKWTLTEIQSPSPNFSTK